MSNYHTGGYIPGPGAPLLVVPKRPHSPEDVHDFIVNRDREIVAGVVWHSDGTMSYGELTA